MAPYQWGPFTLTNVLLRFPFTRFYFFFFPQHSLLSNILCGLLIYYICLLSIPASLYSETTIYIEISSMGAEIFVKNSAWETVGAPPPNL